MERDELEGTPITIKVGLKWLYDTANLSATIEFTQTGGAETVANATVNVPLKGRSSARHEIVLPAVKPDEQSYKLSYKVKCGDKTLDGTESWVVWPKSIELVAYDSNDALCPRFLFKVQQGATVIATLQETQDAPNKGIKIIGLTKPGAVTIDAESPWKIDSWKGDKDARKREVKVSRKPYTADFVHPKVPADPNDELKQYVNLAPLPNTAEGSRLQVKIGAKGDDTKNPDDRLGIEGDILFVQVEFDANNSVRNDPLPRLIIDSKDVALKGGTTNIYEGQVLLPRFANPATFEVELGAAGGDLCTIKIGVTNACSDATLKIRTWRKLWYETWHPKADGADRLSDYSNFLGPTTPGIHAETTKQVQEVLEKVFVEIERIDAGFFAPGSLPGGGQHNCYKHSFFDGKPNDKNILVLTVRQTQDLLSRVGRHLHEPRVLSMVWADYVADEVSWSEKFKFFKDDEKDLKIGSNRRVFPKAIDGSVVAHGAKPVSKISWKAIEWFDGSKFNPIAVPTDPAHALWAAGWNDIVDPAEIAEHVSIPKAGKIKIRFPDTKPHYPGKVLPKDGKGSLTDPATSKIIGLEVMLAGAGVNFVSGVSQRGNLSITTFADEAKTIGLASTILHEAGHCMGQAYADKTVDPRSGRGKPIPNLPFPPGVPAGDVYGGKEHRGPHCAKGIVTKSDADYTPQSKYDEHQCVMFGGPDMRDATKFDYCDNCKTYIKAEDLADVRKDWKT